MEWGRNVNFFAQKTKKTKKKKLKNPRKVSRRQEKKNVISRGTKRRKHTKKKDLAQKKYIYIYKILTQLIGKKNSPPLQDAVPPNDVQVVRFQPVCKRTVSGRNPLSVRAVSCGRILQQGVPESRVDLPIPAPLDVLRVSVAQKTSPGDP